MRQVGNGLFEREFLEDYTVGEVLVSPRRTITETDLVMFAALTGDWAEIHTYEKYGAETQFGRNICHGMLTMSIGNALIHRLGTRTYFPHSFIAFYGMDAVRFHVPVFVGDSLRCELTVRALTPKGDDRGLLEYDTRIVKDPDVTVMTYVQRSLVGRSPGSSEVQ